MDVGRKPACMETKRCLYCHKLQRADAQVCSRCGHMFLSKMPETRSRDLSRPSIPPASPHRAGHYSGLHPEDQPYQSSMMSVQRPPERHAAPEARQEPEIEYLPTS